MRAIDNNQDVLDSRDVIERFDELDSELQDLYSDYVEGGGDLEFEAWLEGHESDEKDEYLILKSLCDEGEGSPDWTHGETLIRESYFEDYAKEMLEDIGTIQKDLPWYVVIDWEATAEHIKQDYMEIDFDGVTYLIRA